MLYTTIHACVVVANKIVPSTRRTKLSRHSHNKLVHTYDYIYNSHLVYANIQDKIVK